MVTSERPFQYLLDYSNNIHHNSITNIIYNDTFFITSSRDSTIRLWNIDDKLDRKDNNEKKEGDKNVFDLL